MSTLTSIRQWIGRELTGREIAFTADASGHSTTTLVDVDQSYLTRSNDMYVDSFLFAPGAAAADKLRQVDTYAASTGTFTVTPAVSSSSIYNSAAYEIWSLLDPLNDVPILINEALRRIPVMMSFNFAAVANSYEQDLTAQQSWLTNRSSVRAAYVLPAASVQQQTITEAGSPSGGTFTLSFKDQDTTALAYNATAAQVQTALRLVPDMGSVTVTRTGSSTNFVWVVTMTGCDPYVPIMETDANSLTGGSSPSLAVEITRNQPTPQLLSGTAVKRGDRVYLQTYRTFASDDRIYVDAIKLAYNHCKTASGVYGGQAGLALETDVCIPDERWVGFGALMIAARRETSTITRATDSALATQGPRWATSFKKLSAEFWSTSRDAELQLDPIHIFGPTGTGLANRSQRYRLGA